MRSLVAAILMCGLGIQSAWACSCVPFSEDKERFRSIDLIFKGRAIETRSEPDGGRITKFEIQQTIKGTEKETREIFLDDGCPTWFDNSREYWVRATRGGRGILQSHGDMYHTNECIMPPESHYDLESARLNAEKSIEELRVAEGEIAKKKSAEMLQASLNHIDFLKFIFEYPTKFRKALRPTERQDPGKLTSLALQAANWRDFERQAELLGVAARNVPDDDRLHIEAAEAYLSIGDLSSAIFHLDLALKVDSGSNIVREMLAKTTLMALGEFTRGETDYRNVNIVDQSLSGRPERGVDFSGSTFFRVDARNFVAHEARFVGVHLSGVDFSKAHLEGASFRNAYGSLGAEVSDFSNALMRRSNLNGSSFRETDFQAVDFTEGSARNAWFDEVSFVEANLEDTDFGDATITYSSLDSATVTGANFDNVEFRGTRLTNVDFTQASIAGADLEGAIVSCATSFSGEIDYANVGIIPLEPECDGVPQNRDFSNRRWWQQNFSGMDLSGANFSGAQFDHSTFFNSNLQGADFTETRGLRYYAGADLSYADFTSATDTGDFTEAVDFENNESPIGLPILSNTIFDSTQLGTGQFIRQWEPTFEFADLSTAHFNNVRVWCSVYTDWSYLEEWAAETESNREGPRQADEQRQERLTELEKRIRERKRLFETEKRLVSFFAKSWPDVEFDDSCSKHLSGEASKDH